MSRIDAGNDGNSWLLTSFSTKSGGISVILIRASSYAGVSKITLGNTNFFIKTMFDIKQLDSQALLNDLKLAYLSQTVAPLDGMWLCGMVPQATHFGVYSKGNLVGFYCLNDEGFVLQFYLDPAHQSQATEIFSLLFKNSNSQVGNAKGAFVSTAEPQFLCYCLDHFHCFQVKSLMYQLASSDELSANQE